MSTWIAHLRIADAARDLHTIYRILWHERRDTASLHSAVLLLP